MKMIYFLTLTATLSLTQFVTGQTLQDFKTADSYTTPTCDWIPYSDLRTRCKDQGKDMHDWCDGQKGPTGCQQNVTSDLVRATTAEYKTLDRLQREKSELKEKSDISAKETKIEESKKRIKDLEQQTSVRKDLVDKTIYTIDKCIDMRTAAKYIFQQALDKLASEQDPQIRPLASSLRGKMENSKEGHNEAISIKNAAKDNCKSERP
jgi:hypothetical protein